MDKMTEGVGKRIVDALKQQSDIEIQNVVENPVPVEEDSFEENNELNFEDNYTEDFNNETTPMVEPQGFTNYGALNVAQPSFNMNSDIDDLEIPTNVAVLKQLISQLPAGVSKQTGAQIIKQTMEALGISMKSVLQEAQQVQENLNHSSRECQASIVEYRKQIGMLERQSQKLQRQYASLNDIISLFVQTNI